MTKIQLWEVENERLTKLISHKMGLQASYCFYPQETKEKDIQAATKTSASQP
jgi:hypothetical protein